MKFIGDIEVLSEQIKIKILPVFESLEMLREYFPESEHLEIETNEGD